MNKKLSTSSKIKKWWEVDKSEWIAPELEPINLHTKVCSINKLPDHKKINLKKIPNKNWRKWDNFQKKLKLNLHLILMRKREGKFKTGWSGRPRVELSEMRSKDNYSKNPNWRVCSISNWWRKCQKRSKIQDTTVPKPIESHTKII